MLGLLGVAWVIGFYLSFRDSPDEHPGVNEAERALIEGPAYQPRDKVEQMVADWEQPVTVASVAVVEAGSPLAPSRAEGIAAAPISENSKEPAALAVASLARAAAPMSWASILSSPTLWCLSFMYFCSNSGWSFFITYVMLYLKNDLQLEGWLLHFA